jgi:TRAP transporter TAXI family solute receptor
MFELFSELYYVGLELNVLLPALQNKHVTQLQQEEEAMKVKKNTCLKFCVAVLTSLMLIASPLSALAAQERHTVRIGSSTLGSSGFILWEAVTYLVNKYSPNLTASAFTTAGSTESVYLLEQQRIEIGHGTGLEVVSGAEGTVPFDKKYDVWQVFGFSMLGVPMIVRADNTAINSYQDLARQRVSLARKGSGAESFYTILLSTLGVYDQVRKSYMEFNAGYDALADRNIVATVASMPDGIPVPQLQDLAQRARFRAVPISPEDMAKVTAANKAMIGMWLPVGAYPGMTESIHIPAYPGIGISGPHVSDDVIYELCKAVLDNVDELRSISRVNPAITLENAVGWLIPGYPVHPGAARYFKEKGVWRDDLVVGVR